MLITLMFKKLSVCFIVFVFSHVSFSQDYSMVQKQIKVKSEKRKYEINITYPQLIGHGNTPYNAFNSLVKEHMEAERDSFKVWMKDWEINEYNRDFSSEYEINFSKEYNDDNLISIFFSVYSYFAGAAHPNNSCFSLNYDLKNSKEIFLSDLLISGWENKISEICIREITKQKKEMGIEPDEWLTEGAGPKPENFDVFNIKRDTLVITFPTYQVGAYVEGPSEVDINYAEIKDIINPKGILKSFRK